ncbi:MAG TPA: sigma-70 family RNA polymerase sigma factor [Actinomycetes bacterium]|jgi:RNA polymerase sigma-70 factor (ECF subfamily)|nr:sigma-70 family RNA polymerase sigma factor [Actinomycetes bacterium]
MTSTRTGLPVVPADLKRRFELEALPLLPGMHAAARHLTRNASDAEDLVQETYLRAYRGFARFQPGTNLRAWLHRILINTFINDHRKRRRLPNLILEDGSHQRSRSWRMVERDPEPSAEDLVLGSLPDQAVQQALALLPAQFRMAVLLADVQGFTYREIAQIAGVPIGTVMSRLHRGRSALSKQLWQLASDTPPIRPPRPGRQGRKR